VVCRSELLGKDDNVVIVSAGERKICCLCVGFPGIPAEELHVGPDIGLDGTMVSVVFSHLDPGDGIGRIHMAEKWKPGLIGLPVVPEAETFFVHHNKVCCMVGRCGQDSGFVGPNTIFRKMDKKGLDEIVDFPIDKHISRRIFGMVRNRSRIVSRTLLICGENDGGKSVLLKFMRQNIRECRSLKLLEVLADMESGQSRHISAVLNEFSDGILLIEDIDLFPEAAASRLSCVLAEVAKTTVLVIATSRAPLFSLPHVLQAHFSACVSMNALSAEKRREFIASKVQTDQLELLVRETAGLGPSEICSVLEILADKAVFLEQDIRKVISCLSVSSRPLLMSSTEKRICGCKGIMDEIRLLIRVAVGSGQNQESLVQYSGVLLHGPSGNGKSLIISKLSEEFAIPFYVLQFERVFSRFLGDSEKGIRDVFSLARSFAPCVVVIEDIDAIGSKRSDESGVGGRVLSTLLNELDGISANKSVFLLATTCQVGSVDSALLRPGRFDRLIEVGNPELEDRLEMLKDCRQRIPMDARIGEEWFGDVTSGFRWGEIESLFRYCALQSLYGGHEIVGMETFEAGVERLRSRRRDVGGD
jgi:ATP-dependent 26S proteasome regulatory subunit